MILICPVSQLWYIQYSVWSKAQEQRCHRQRHSPLLCFFPCTNLCKRILQRRHERVHLFADTFGCAVQSAEKQVNKTVTKKAHKISFIMSTTCSISEAMTNLPSKRYACFDKVVANISTRALSCPPTLFALLALLWYK